MALNQKAQEAIRTALVHEFSDMMLKKSGGCIALQSPMFEITFEPNTPMISLDTSEALNEPSDFAVYVHDRILGDFIHNCKGKVGTFRRHASEDEAVAQVIYEANSWQDLVEGLNQGLREKNKIDPSILGKGKK